MKYQEKITMSKEYLEDSGTPKIKDLAFEGLFRKASEDVFLRTVKVISFGYDSDDIHEKNMIDGGYTSKEEMKYLKNNKEKVFIFYIYLKMDWLNEDSH